MEIENINPLLLAWREAKNKLQLDTGPDDTYTGLRLQVFGLKQIEKYKPGSNEVCISIYANPNEKFDGCSRPTGISKDFDAILYEQFDDKPDLKSYDSRFDGVIEISEEQANQIAQFVFKNKEKRKIVIHCFAGASRSRSVAAAIATVLHLPYNFTVLNSKVYQMVTKALEESIKL